jgi:REP element-mobilizing transposase RayT
VLIYHIFSIEKVAEKLLFSPKYRGKVLEGEVAEAAEEISWIAKRIKGRSSKLLRDQFPQLIAL